MPEQFCSWQQRKGWQRHSPHLYSQPRATGFCDSQHPCPSVLFLLGPASWPLPHLANSVFQRFPPSISHGKLFPLFKKKIERGLSERVEYFTIWQYFCIQKLYDKSEPFRLLCRSDTCAEPIGREWLLCLVCYHLLQGWGKQSSPVERALYQSVNFSEEQLTGCHSLVTSPEEKIGSYQESTQTILI